jgi:hypothetical protein
MADRNDDPFRDLQRPELPVALRRRVLESAARAALAAPGRAGWGASGQTGWVDRLWMSRLARVGLALVLFALLGGHLVVSRSSAPWTAAGTSPAHSFTAAASVVRILEDWPSLEGLFEDVGEDAGEARR